MRGGKNNNNIETTDSLTLVILASRFAADWLAHSAKTHLVQPQVPPTLVH